MKKNKSFKSIEILIGRLIDGGSLKPEQRDVVVKELRGLEQALKVKNFKEVRKAVDGLARQFLKV